MVRASRVKTHRESRPARQILEKTLHAVRLGQILMASVSAARLAMRCEKLAQLWELIV
jgi:hypothetical protein